MTPARVPGDEATVSVVVRVDVETAFRVFTEEIDRWWRRGLRYRIGRDRSMLHLEPWVGGRLFEAIEPGRVVETGRVTAWEPPHRLVFEWRAVNFAPDEKTEVEVSFTPSASGTTVVLTHRGWSRLRPDHPVRHGADVPTFIRNMGLWWAALMTSLREHVDASREIT